MNFKKFFEPSWKKLKWFFVIFFIAQLYVYVIMPFIPTILLQGFINFILNPTTLLFESRIVEPELSKPIIITLNAMWNYFLATIISKELENKK
ncbi:MAG: hypothetical protein PHX27_03085 [Candidatus ainarchaeum sp.]|nr:hypothetical protein [Candidatus ainarchaeum sp.]